MEKVISVVGFIASLFIALSGGIIMTASIPIGLTLVAIAFLFFPYHWIEATKHIKITNTMRLIGVFSAIVMVSVFAMMDSNESFVPTQEEKTMIDIYEEQKAKEAEAKRIAYEKMSDEEKLELQEKEKAEIERKKAEAKEAEALRNWSIYRDIDAMDDSEVLYAIAESENEVKFGFPYGDNYFNLTIRNKNGKNDVLLKCTKSCQFIGQGPYDTEKLRIRFDSAPAEKYSYNGPADYSSDVIFIKPADKFVNKIKKADTVKIEAPFYNEGRRIIEFNTYGLKWEK